MSSRRSRSRSRSRSPERPNFTPSGILARYENENSGIAIKYTEPLDASLPRYHWRLFVYEGNNEKDPIDLHIKSSYIIGRDENIADILIPHMSVSKEHAAIQFRKRKSHILPYIIDLESKNGTYLNDKKLEAARFYEIQSQDILTFGTCEMEYVAVKGDKLRYRE
ncbi:unnamed protein product [Blepharisma stoltei]|uniref:FHA domain-containing protein n=1 Tax=Blepharisma stoltei TaxID=1481888 RepID=A0AAU9J6V9_9CILI|nr:unnamed protein product [Blepharisma stoltei]